MELYNIDNLIMITDGNKCMKILDNSDYRFWIMNEKKERKLSGTSFKITEYDRMLYKIFSDFYDSLVEEYNSFKQFNDYKYDNHPLYDEKHNWFTFYDDYSNIEDSNIFRIIKNEKKEPYTIGIYIKNNDNRLQSHTLAKSGSRYPQFLDCFYHLTSNLKKLEKQNTHIKKKEV